MAAITKNFTSILDASVDPDSPVDTALVTALRDNDIHLREWLGASYTAGAKQDHSHDGVDSALVEIGPNYLRNGSAENGESGWTFTDYSGGSHAISSSQRQHGIKSFSFTSTVLANGGGWAESNEYVPVGGSQFLSVEGWRWASVANVSSKCELVWYDVDKAQISTSSVFSDTNTATSATLVQTGIQAPSTARFVRLRITGGVPASGSATGTVYFDGWMIGRTYVVEPLIGPAAVTQSKLKTSTQESSVNADGGSASSGMTLTGGTYCLAGWQSKLTGTGGGGVSGYPSWSYGEGETSYSSRITLNIVSPSGNNTFYLNIRYVQASPPYEPYRIGDAVPLFTFALIEKTTGRVISTSTAEDPPWANNGPTLINPMGRLRAFALSRIGTTPEQGRQNPALQAQLEDEMDALYLTMRDPKMRHMIHAEMARRFTQAEKNADMALIPHPFGSYDPAKHVVLALNPTDDKFCRGLNARHCILGDSVAEALHEGHIILDNSPMPGLVTPPSVMAVRARWKLTK